MAPLRVLELYSGIGGCAAALGESATTVAAVDVNRIALRVYRDNFPHPTHAALIEAISIDRLRQWGADLWWLSPPCQPFTQRGLQRDLDDPRARTLIAMLEHIAEVRPPYLAIENVPGFDGSRAHRRLLQILRRAGYTTILECIRCPTEFGIPNRRRRYYLIAARGSLLPLPTPRTTDTPLNRCLDPDPDPNLDVEPDLIDRYSGALHIVRADDPAAETQCFTSAYGRSVVRSGSYLATDSGVRRFSPTEILRLLGFPAGYRLPADLPLKNGWRLVGSSLSIPVVRSLLSTVPELAGAMAADRRSHRGQPPMR